MNKKKKLDTRQLLCFFLHLFTCLYAFERMAPILLNVIQQSTSAWNIVSRIIGWVKNILQIVICFIYLTDSNEGRLTPCSLIFLFGQSVSILKLI
jgi:hypothetical protein